MNDSECGLDFKCGFTTGMGSRVCCLNYLFFFPVTLHHGVTTSPVGEHYS